MQSCSDERVATKRSPNRSISLGEGRQPEAARCTEGGGEGEEGKLAERQHRQQEPERRKPEPIVRPTQAEDEQGGGTDRRAQRPGVLQEVREKGGLIQLPVGEQSPINKRESGFGERQKSWKPPASSVVVAVTAPPRAPPSKPFPEEPQQ